MTIESTEAGTDGESTMELEWSEAFRELRDLSPDLPEDPDEPKNEW